MPADGLDSKVKTEAETAKERFDLAREIIRHEDGLVNSRVTWLQVFQGLLFTAFFAGLNLFKEANLPRPDIWHPILVAALSILPILGVLSSYAAYKATSSALNQIYAVESWWRDVGYQAEFPPLAGEHGAVFGTIKLLGAHMLLVYSLVWVAFLLAFLFVAFQIPTPNRSLNRTLHSVPAFVPAKTLAQIPSRCSGPVSFDVRHHPEDPRT